MNEQERQDELVRLELTLREVERQLAISEENCSEKHAETRDALLDYWGLCGGNIADEAQLVEAANRQRALSTLASAVPRNLRRLLTAPYFGRIDFREDEFPDDEEKIYIGLASLVDEKSGEFLVYDWRAPVSAMFYEGGTGRAGYDCPAGRIDGRIGLKRQYKIENGTMKFMFDAELKIDDEMLQEVLSKSVDHKMKTIVNSIQRDQNAIIRDGENRALFVEGPAGSGKTSVALHRVAFLLYRDRAILNERNVLILSPNHVFSDYISSVLPEMGEKNVLQMTFQDYAETVMAEQPVQFETRTAHLEVVLSPAGGDAQAVRAANIRLKSSEAWQTALDLYIAWLEEHLTDGYPAIVARGREIFSRDQWRHYYNGMFRTLPPKIRLDKIRQLIVEALRPVVAEARAAQEERIRNSGNEVNGKTILALARAAAQSEMQPVYDQLDRLTRFSTIGAYRRLFKKNWLRERFGQAVALPENWPAIQKQTLSFLNNGILPQEDLAPFLYFQGNWQGFPVRRDIKHLIVDEAQDYTALHFKILRRIFPDCSWTVVGDTAQAIHPFLRTADFALMNEIVALQPAHTFRLSRSYRSTKEIQEFCQALLPKAQVAPVGRSGSRPQIVASDSQNALWAAAAEAVGQLQQAGRRSIGLICKNIDGCRQAFAALDGRLTLKLAIEEEGGFHRGVVVIPSYLAKGLEFDAVLVLDADARHYRRQEERNLLYTVCTRALHELQLFYCQAPSPFLADAETVVD